MSDDTACKRCNELYSLRDGDDDTGLCDHCAQEMAAEGIDIRADERAKVVAEIVAALRGPLAGDASDIADWIEREFGGGT